MTKSAGTKFGKELDSFLSLIVLNIIFSAIAMAASIIFTTANLKTAADLILQGSVFVLGPITMWPHPQFLLVILGLVGAAFSLKWLITSVEIMSDADDIKTQYSQESKQLDNQAATSLIVRAMAYYREKKTTIQRLGLFSRLGGLCFLASSIIQAVNGLLLTPAPDSLHLLLIAVSVMLNATAGIAGILSPRYFFRYSSTWEYRLNESVKAEEELKRLLRNS